MGEANMDFWNNQQGREIAEELRHEFGGSLKNIFTDNAISDIIADRVVKRLRSGALITSPEDKRNFLVKKLNLPIRNDNIKKAELATCLSHSRAPTRCSLSNTPL